MMIYQYTAAALVSENKVLAHPATADTIPTSGNQEDHVSMGSVAALHARRVLANVERVLGIELVVAAQALDLRLADRGRTGEPGRRRGPPKPGPRADRPPRSRRGARPDLAAALPSSTRGSRLADLARRRRQAADVAAPGR